MFSFNLLHACYSDSYVFFVFWNFSLTVASLISPILQSTCLDPCLSPMNSKIFLFVFEDRHHLAVTSLIRLVRMIIRQCFFPHNTLSPPTFFFPLVTMAEILPVRTKLNVVTLETFKIEICSQSPGLLPPVFFLLPSFFALQWTSDPIFIIFFFFISTYIQFLRLDFVSGILFPRISVYLGFFPISLPSEEENT